MITSGAEERRVRTDDRDAREVNDELCARGPDLVDQAHELLLRVRVLRVGDPLRCKSAVHLGRGSGGDEGRREG